MAPQSPTLKAQLQVPLVAWPTMALFVVCVGTWGLVIWAVSTSRLGYGWGMVWSTVALYGIFTPLHEALHQSTSRSRGFNAALGRVCGFLYMGLFVGFRFIHLTHHSHTNDPERDPDMWVARGPTWALPLRWLTLDLYYHVFYLRHAGQRPSAERVEALVTGIALTAALVGLVWLGLGWPMLLLWMVPLKLAYWLLAYSFDYLPHRPHEVSAQEDRYRATLMRPHPLLSVLLLYQNLHLIHHLYPAVPFYRYGAVWRGQREALLAHGVEVRSLTGRVLHPTGLESAAAESAT